MLRSLPLLCLLACSSCFLNRSRIEAPLDARQVQELAPGQSDAQDVLELLGAPTDVIQLGARSAWLYEHVEEKKAGLVLLVIGFINSDRQSDRVWLFFDETGLLTHAGSSFDSENAEFDMPWEKQ